MLFDDHHFVFCLRFYNNWPLIQILDDFDVKGFKFTQFIWKIFDNILINSQVMLIGFWKIQHIGEDRSYIKFTLTGNILLIVKHRINLTHVIFVSECDLALPMSVLSLYYFINLELYIFFRKCSVDYIFYWNILMLFSSFAGKSSDFKIWYFSISDGPV